MSQPKNPITDAARLAAIRANDLEIALIKQSLVAKTVAEELGAGHRQNFNGPLSHSHHCRHCDLVLSCDLAECPIAHDISRVHQCGERQAYNRRMRKLLSPAQCKFKCARECSHPKKEPYYPEEEQWPFMRPEIPETVKVSQAIQLAGGSKTRHSEECCCDYCKKAYRLTA